jgi:hypothetical protein
MVMSVIRSAQVTPAAGPFSSVTSDLPEPGPGQVRLPMTEDWPLKQANAAYQPTGGGVYLPGKPADGCPR